MLKTKEEIDDYFDPLQAVKVGEGHGTTDKYENYKHLDFHILDSTKGRFILLEKDGKFTIFKEE
jgi:hypothetical protein